MTGAGDERPTIGAVLFDKDGTLFDFRQSWGGFARRLIASLAQQGARSDRIAAAIGFDLATGDFDAGSPVIADTAEQIVDGLLPLMPGMQRAMLIDQINDMAAEAEMAEVVPLIPLFGALRARGLRIGLATNDVEAAARAHLTAVGVVDLFDVVFGADSGHGAKPAPGMLLAFARTVGLQPGRVVMVGDSRHDLIAGREAGMPVVAVLTGIATAEDLAPFADAVLRDIGELPAWIDARHAG